MSNTAQKSEALVAGIAASIRSLARGRSVLAPQRPFDAEAEAQTALVALTELRARIVALETADFDREAEAYNRKVLGHEFDLLEIDQRADKEMRHG